MNGIGREPRGELDNGMSDMAAMLPRTIDWVGDLDGRVVMIDQTRLPHELVMLDVQDVEAMWHAIRRLSVRGAPAIGIAAAMGVVLGAREFPGGDTLAFVSHVREVGEYLKSSRPTAVNLAWAVERMAMVARNPAAAHRTVTQLQVELLAEARRIRDEDAAMCRAIGQHGQTLIPDGGRVLTYCNAGWLATAEYGTALAPMYTAWEQGRRFEVFACETRPLLQGARLTAWELQQAGIPVTLLTDNMVAALMGRGGVDLVIVGADRIAANGDTANKIGTYGVAVLARAHGIPFYVAAPSSTFDLALASGDLIPIEERDPVEVRRFAGQLVAPEEVRCLTPAFDVTPAEYISGIITERGIVRPVTRHAIAATQRG